MSAIQQVHDIEFNGGLTWPEDGRILVYLGCPLDPPPRQRMFGEALVESFAEAEAWLRGQAKHYGATLAPGGTPACTAIVQRLFDLEIPGSVRWVYDGDFAMTLGPLRGDASSWAEAEEWFAELAAASSG
jgi:hypothetical protein